MIRTRYPFIAVAVFVLISQAQAQNEKSLTRDEVTVFKKKLVGLFESLGQPPAGYSMERESFNLPTDAYTKEGSSSYSPIGTYAAREYGTSKSAENASKDLEKEYKKKMMEAQAKADYQEMGRLAQEMQQKIGQLSLKTEETRKDPISVDIGVNSGGGEPIDPDAVVHEQSGVIALRHMDGMPERSTVKIYIDPVTLKDTKQLSKVTLNYPEGGVAKRTTVLHATIQFTGPSAEIEAWAKRVDFKRALAQVDR